MRHCRHHSPVMRTDHLQGVRKTSPTNHSLFKRLSFPVMSSFHKPTVPRLGPSTEFRLRNAYYGVEFCAT